tara:strand:- start:230 stop:967 length:738 start_codon:yes stop_codon:yes gene_type:complete
MSEQDQGVNIEAPQESIGASPAIEAPPQGVSSPAESGVTGPPETIPYGRFQESRQQLQEARQAMSAMYHQLQDLKTQVDQGQQSALSPDQFKEGLKSLLTEEDETEQWVDPLEKALGEERTRREAMESQLAQIQTVQYGQMLQPRLEAAMQQYPEADVEDIKRGLLQSRDHSQQVFNQLADQSQKQRQEFAQAWYQRNFPGQPLPNQPPAPPQTPMTSPGNPAVGAGPDVSGMSYRQIAKMMSQG